MSSSSSSLKAEHQSNSEMNSESYPPMFRQPSHLTMTNIDHDTFKPVQDSDHAIPLIDLQCIDLDKLDQACKDWGVFRLVNHGIPETLLRQLQEHAKQLFSLSFETKQTLFSPSPGQHLSYFWGSPALTPAGEALVSDKGIPQSIHWVEGLNVPLSQLSQLQTENPLLDSFRVLLEEYGKHLSRLATTLYENMARNLNLNLNPLDYDSKLSVSTGLLRVHRYPHGSTKDELKWGVAAHTDSAVLAILNQDDEVSSLEVLKDGDEDDDRWLSVKPISNTLIVNLGDMMQAMSNDEYKSVKHRVKVNKHKDRISLCYFVFPAEGTVVPPNSTKYKPFTYSDFQSQVQHDLKTLGYRVGLDRFKNV